MSLKLITAPITEPVTLAEAQVQCRVDDVAFDNAITSMIKSARMAAEELSGRSLLSQTWEITLDNFPDQIRLPRPPVTSIVSVKYIDVNNVEQTLSSGSYTLDNASDDGVHWLVLAANTSWPLTYENINVVKVRYIAGYANAAAVPETIKQWMLYKISTMFDNPSGMIIGKTMNQIPFMDNLINQHKVYN